MGQLWDLLRNNPILIFVLVAWIGGAIANVIRSQRKAADRQTSRPAPAAAPAARQAPAPRSRPAPPPTRTGSKSPDDVAAEMRRILGLDPDNSPVEPQPRQPVSRPAVRQRAAAEKPPTPLAPRAATRLLEKHIDSHVGEGMSRSKDTRSGRVGTHDREWGTLGGRRRNRVVALAVEAAHERAIDLTNLKRLIIGAEILGPPVALRDPSQQRLF